MKDKILVTGAGGFVGSNLTNALSDNYQFIFIKRVSDVNTYNWNNLAEAFSENTITAVIHLAGIAHDMKGAAKAEDYYKVNTELTKQVFDLYLNSSANQFFYFSSVKAVADDPEAIITELTAAQPKTDYGKSKFLAEQYLLSKKTEKKVYIIRPCMIHGPKNKGNLNMLFTLIKKGIPYPFASFNNRRSLLYIGNLNFLIKNMIEAAPESGIYNFADDNPLSTVDMITVMSSALNKKPLLVHVPKGFIGIFSRLGDRFKFLPFNSQKLKKLTGNFVVDNSKIKNALKIDRLPFSTNEGLVETTIYFNQKM